MNEFVIIFMMLIQSLKPEVTRLLLGDLDLSKFKPYEIKDSKEVILVYEGTESDENPIVISSIIYEVLTTYIRKMNGLQKQDKKAGNEYTRKKLIYLARQDAEIAKNIEKYNETLKKQGVDPTKLNNAARMNTRNINSKASSEDVALREKKRVAALKDSTEYYNSNAKPGSLAAKANMVKQYNEKNNK